jgi:ribosomal protein S18 acetylase RimI-like enzyme
MIVTLLASEVDKLGNIIDIKKCDTIAHSPVFTFFLRTMAETIDSGFGYPVTSWKDDDCEVVYAESNGKILGNIVYSKSDSRTLFIELAAVDKEFRNRGIYGILYKHVENVARSYNYDAISSLVHKSNSIVLESIKKVDRYPQFCFYAKRL